MVTNEQMSGQESALKKAVQRFNQLGLFTKVIIIAVLAFLVYVAISIPGDRNELLTRQERVEVAQTAFDEALPTISPVMENVATHLDESEADLSGNQTYSRITSAVTTFNRTTSTTTSRFQAVIRFSENVHALVDGDNAVEELDTEEFRTLLSEMDATLSTAWLALMELNISVDEYNRYNNRISAKITSLLFGLPQSYPDPVSANSQLNRNTTLLRE